MNFRYYLNLLSEAAYDSMIQSMVKTYPNYADEINWAKNLKRQDRVVWYLKQLKELFTNDSNYWLTIDPTMAHRMELRQIQDNLWHFIGQENIANIQNYQFRDQTFDQVMNDLRAIERKYHSGRQQPGAYNPPGDRVLLQFPDGTQWVHLDRAYCEQEGLSGKHCGNVVGQTKKDQRILSYRRADHTVILTFILEPDGTLGEMKGVANTKPQERYHPAIMQLLLQPYIKGISGMGFLPDQNFSIFDLSDQNLQVIANNKPKLIIDQIKITPTEILNAPDWIKNNTNYTQYIDNEGIKSLISDSSMNNWERAISNDVSLILYAPDDLPDYENRLLKFLSMKYAPQLLLRIRKKYRSDPRFLEKLLIKKPFYIRSIVPNIREYDKLCLIAVQKDGRTLKYIPEELRTAELCRNAVQSYSTALQWVPRELKTFELCRIAVMKSSSTLKHIPADLRTPELCRIAVMKSGLALLHVPKKLRTPELCRIAVEKDGLALRYVPKELRTPEIYHTAVKNNSSMLYYVPEELKTPKLYRIAVKGNGNMLIHVPEKSRTPKLCRIAVEKNGGALRHVPEKLRTLEICRIAVNEHGWVLQYVPQELRTPELCRIAVEKTPYALEYVPEELRTPELCRIAVEKYGLALMYVPQELRTPELCRIAVEKIPYALQYVPEELRTRELCRIAVEENPRTLEYVPQELQPIIKKELGLTENITRLKQLAGII